MNIKSNITDEDEQQAREYVRNVKGFYNHFLWYVVVTVCLFIANFFTSPEYIWAWWVLLGWGIGIVLHAINVFEWFNLFSEEWEREQIKKRLDRK